MYIEEAFKVKHDWWRYIIGLVLAFIGWQMIGLIPLTLVAFSKSNGIEHFIKAAENSFTDLDIDPNLFLVLVIIGFAIGLLGLLLAVKYIHEQKIISLTTSRSKVDWKRIWFSFFMVIILNLTLFLISYVTEPEIYELNFKVMPFVILLIISIFLLPLQTSFEEYLFRGYLMQGIGVLAKNRWLPLLLTSVMFGLLHGFNPEVAKLGNIMMIYYIGTGFLFGVMTLMDEGMELALGFHAANNMLAAILVTTDWSAFQTDAIFKDISEPSAGLDIMLPIAIQYPIIIFILAKKYKWSGWKEKLTGSVTPESVTHINN